MKKLTIESIKLIAGICAGTLAVVFAMWFMAGGVMLLPAIIIIPVLVLLFFFGMLAAGAARSKLLAAIVVGSFVCGWFGFDAYYRYTCGPNPKDVAVMKPMAQKISDYIVKHGIPKSLEDIPGLPYRLEGCERSENGGERCHYKKDFAYSVHIYTPITNELAVEIFNEDSRTGIQYWFKKNNKEIILTSRGKGYSSKTDGICNPMKQ